MFLFAMVAATLANSLGVQWVALEGTTLATTFLIAFFRKRESLEAGWKYLILCSVGIALALFGVVLTYYSSVRVLGDASSALNMTELIGVANQLDPNVLKLAFIFILVGYGTKVGLVPMHTWLPDAYSEAPAPIAAMLAGVLETVAVYTVLRSKSLVDQALPPEFSGNLLLTFGLLSFVVASLFILIQHNYKRLFAYSSIEHMGLAMIGFGVGGLVGTFAGLFHLLNHALAKALAFFCGREYSPPIRDAGDRRSARAGPCAADYRCGDSRGRLRAGRIAPILAVRQRAPGSVGSGCAGLCVRYGACRAVYDHDDSERDAQPRHRHGASVLRRRLVWWIYVSRRGNGVGRPISRHPPRRTVDRRPCAADDHYRRIVGAWNYSSRTDSEVADQGRQRDCSEVIV